MLAKMLGTKALQYGTENLYCTLSSSLQLRKRTPMYAWERIEQGYLSDGRKTC
jgi:hypothetical protein